MLEFQIEPDAEILGRILDHLAAIWKHERPDPGRGSRYCVGAAVVNLTGRVRCSQEMNWPRAGLKTHVRVIERNLQDERADEQLGRIEAGQTSRNLLPFIALIHGGDNASIIQRWVAAAKAEPDEKRRSDYAGFASIFAERVGRKAVWEGPLKKEMNVTESPWLNECIAKGEARGRIIGARATVLRQASRRFGAPSAEQGAALNAITDCERLERVSDRVIEAANWDDLLATP